MSTFLEHSSPFQLLIAVILSAQCTDEMVNRVTPTLFNHFPTATKLAKATLQEIEDDIRSINYFRTKAKNIKGTATSLIDTYKGQVPACLDALITLPGVGRKTANVVLGQAFDIPGITVDTHVKRVSYRLGFTKETDPVKVESDLMTKWPKSYWNMMSTILILHGRHTCKARTPLCQDCEFNEICPQKGVT